MKKVTQITPIRIFVLTLSIFIVFESYKSVWTSMSLLVIGAGILDAVLMLLIDYLLIRNMITKHIWIVEILLIVFVFGIKLLNDLSWNDMLFFIY